MNDKNSEPRTFYENNLHSLITVLLDNRNSTLCTYIEDKFFSYYMNDEFALECGMISVARDANFPSSLSYLMDEFKYLFNSTSLRLFFLRQLELEEEEGEREGEGEEEVRDY